MALTKRYSYLLETFSLLTIIFIIGDFFIKWSYLFGAYATPSTNFFTRMIEHQYAGFATTTHGTTLFSAKTISLFLIDSISPLVLILGVIQFIRLLHLYRTAGTFFSVASLDRYTLVCRYALLWTLYGPLNSMLTTLILTISNPPGHRVLEITLQSRDIAHACIVGFFYFVAHIMQEALSIKNEIDLTV